MRPMPERDLFMMCPALNREALRPVPAGFSIRRCRKGELDAWIGLQADDPAQRDALRAYLTEYFQNIYAPAGDLFYEQCLFAVDEGDEPVGTVFIWKAYGRVNTVHWFKVLPALEGRGIGRALLSHALEALKPGDFPVFLHTQPGSFRAIKLYADFGFRFLADERVGGRVNGLAECLPALREVMPREAFERLKTASAPAFFLDAASSSPVNQF